MREILSKMIAEFLGTFVLLFMGCGAIMMHSLYPDTVTTTSIPIVFGGVIMVMIYTLGHISGAHFNPAVTLAFSSIGSFPWRQVPFYWVSQITGAFMAIALLSYLLPEVADYGMTYTKLGSHQSFVFEVTLTFILMLVIVGATDMYAQGIMVGLAVGGVVMLDAFVGGVVTGASMNPARSIAPALFVNKLEHLWIYILAPSTGALMAAFTYKFLLCKTQKYKLEEIGSIAHK